MTKTALITGITGQDGAYLARILLNKGYVVHGLRQPSSVPDLARIENLLPEITLHYGDLTDGASLMRILSVIEPDEIYNLAAQSHVHVSYDAPEYTLLANGLGPLKILESIRALGGEDHTKLFQASTSEMFGNARPPQSEHTDMVPLSPYAAAKKYAFNMMRIYRSAYGLYACNGIMFNHESPIRGEEFVTRKIAKAAARIKNGRQDCLYLGNLNAKRDWSHAEDIMQAAWLMMQQALPDDYILSSGVSATVREFAQKTFALAGFDIVWKGQGVSESGIDQKSGKTLIRIDPRLFRPLEVEDLCGDPSKIRALGWKPRWSLDDMIAEMFDAELKLYA